MSSAPTQDAPSGKLPTGNVSFGDVSVQLALSGFHASPQGYTSASGPRAAYSHSRSVGRRTPLLSQWSLASSRSTQLCGWPSSDGNCALIQPVEPICAFVTSYLSIQNGSSKHCSWMGCSSSSPSSLPIIKHPAGTSTIVTPSKSRSTGVQSPLRVTGVLAICSGESVAVAVGVFDGVGVAVGVAVHRVAVAVASSASCVCVAAARSVINATMLAVTSGV